MSNDSTQKLNLASYEQAKKLEQELQRRYERANARLESSRKQFQEIITDAKLKFGVSNLAELEALKKKQEDENKQALDLFSEQAAAFMANLNEVERLLDEANV